MKSLSGYVPVFNNSGTVVAAVHSLREQTLAPNDVFAIDDGSSDGSIEQLKANNITILRQPSNLGRGAARHRAMFESKGELVLCCDATNKLPADFVSRALSWFEDPKVAAVYGRIQDPEPRGIVGRWRARHLFKANYPMTIRHQAPLITYGTLMRRSAVLDVGNFDLTLRHSEDAELGERLRAAGYDIVFDPLPVYCNVQNTLTEVLERYWRWYAGKDEHTSLTGYWKNIVFSIKGMAWQDLMVCDPLAVLISLTCPHYQFWKSRIRRWKRENATR